ncbi:hypothetical protein [Brevundimonas pondensis]|uniref:Uncharacterized protein n=1 Tax=Brevundimonas pondensis TaxID=2774189 RepID=A0ABX7SI64_9CAUL|nr:hypothetical protein [Brevundimonas pondensis]QTC87103.1 hypothetical protein IFE19_13395 [Brevundimonas pondensis]
MFYWLSLAMENELAMRHAAVILASTLVGCSLFGTPSPVTACTIREPVDREAAWATYRSEVETILVGQVVALHPYTRTERRNLDARRIAGHSYGTQAGWADVAPVETILGPAHEVRARYSNGYGCGRDLWNPRLGDFVLVLIGQDGFADVRAEDDLEDPILRAHIKGYWSTDNSPAP